MVAPVAAGAGGAGVGKILASEVGGNLIADIIKQSVSAALGTQSGGEGKFLLGADTDIKLRNYVRNQNAIRALTGQPFLDYDDIVSNIEDRTRRQLEESTDRKIREISAGKAYDLAGRQFEAQAGIERQALSSQADVIRAEEGAGADVAQAFLKGALENVLKRPNYESSTVLQETARAV